MSNVLPSSKTARGGYMSKWISYRKAARTFSLADSSVSVSNSSPEPNNTVTYTVTLKSILDFPLTGASPAPQVTASSGTLGTPVYQGLGEWTFTHTQNTSGTANINISYKGESFPTESLTYVQAWTPGLTPALWIDGGNKGNSWQNKQIDVSAYIGRTARIAFYYLGGNGYQSDYQVDTVQAYNGISWSFNSSPENWQRSTNYTTNYNSVNWSSSFGDSSQKQWNRRSSSTSSGGTGVTSGTWLYYEGTGGHSSNTHKTWIRSPQWTITYGSILWRYGAYGGNMGSWKFYLDLVG